MTKLGDAAHRVHGWLRRAWIQRPAWLLTPLTLMTVLVVVLGVLWFRDFTGDGETHGTIVVGSPAIYTRERLVNDRFLQDSWLSARLDPSTEIQDSRLYRSERRGGSVRVGDAKDGGSAEAASGPEQQPRLSSRARLSEDVDYREQVRNLTIENQLDDRHDLNGNSLYRFRFDASVLPGSNTQASARITVRLTSPAFLRSIPDKGPLSSVASLGDVEAWRDIYRRWIENLHARLNQTHRELKQSYHGNEFSHNDYAQLVAFLLRSLDITVGRAPQCPAAVVELQGPRTPAVQLSAQEHAKRKGCVEAIVEQTIRADVVSIPPNVTQGTYIDKGPRFRRPGPAATTPTFDRSRLAANTVEEWLNKFFAAKTVKLVLGLVVPETSFVGNEFYGIPAFRNLVRLTFFTRSFDARDGNAFEVTQRVFPVAAIRRDRVTNEELKRLASLQGEFQGHTIDNFAAERLPGLHPFLLSRLHLDMMKDDTIAFEEKEFRPAGDGDAFYLATAEIGLLNFARAARANAQAFTYGVIPRESADSIDLTLSSGTRFDASPSAGDRAPASVQLRRDATTRALERRNAVVGFAGVGRDHRSPEFGWAIAPRGTSLDGTRPAYVQTPAQYALSALVSIPSWWSKAEFHVTTTWIGKDGESIKGTRRRWAYVVDVPMDFEPLEASLLGIEQLGPELMESRLDPVVLTACRPGAIVIPGRRLWRSTKVTLGYQTADAISVLPNMKGIIATFHEVQNQMSLEEESALRKKREDESIEIHRPVRVWTSQGSLILPRSAQIRVPAGSRLGCAPRAKAPESGKSTWPGE